MSQNYNAQASLQDDSHYEEFPSRREPRRVSVPRMKQLDYNPRIRNSVIKRESFIVQFAKTRGPPQIVSLVLLMAIGFGSTIGVVPAVMTDRFARLNHGYMGEYDCSDYDVIDKPRECLLGSGDAQAAATMSNFASNGMTFLTSSLMGSLTDEHGRKGILTFGLSLGLLAPVVLYLIQVVPDMSPWWYYGCHASSGLSNWMAVSMSALADVLPPEFRAPGIGLQMAGFMLGFSLAPVLSFFLSRQDLSLLSILVVVGGMIATVFVVPETVPPQVALQAKAKREALEMARSNNGVWQRIQRFLYRPFQEMSILNRDSFFRLISLLAFFSGMVSAGDRVLLVYYVEADLGFSERDVSIIFLIIGVMGFLCQLFVLKPLNDWVGEKHVVIISFVFGVINNMMNGFARDKGTILFSSALASINMMAFPTISAIKANNVDETEQGRVQGALYSIQALASGVGPILMQLVYSNTKDAAIGPGAMFVFAGALYLVAVGAACMLPEERSNIGRSSEGGNMDVSLLLSDAEDSFDESDGYGSIAR